LGFEVPTGGDVGGRGEVAAAPDVGGTAEVAAPEFDAGREAGTVGEIEAETPAPPTVIVPNIPDATWNRHQKPIVPA